VELLLRYVATAQLAEELSAYQEGLCSNQLVTYLVQLYIQNEKHDFLRSAPIISIRGTVNAVQIGMSRPSRRQCSYSLQSDPQISYI
jgi:hypothetical protein